MAAGNLIESDHRVSGMRHIRCAMGDHDAVACDHQFGVLRYWLAGGRRVDRAVCGPLVLVVPYRRGRASGGARAGRQRRLAQAGPPRPFALSSGWASCSGEMRHPTPG
jgi:hypothetical protein